VSRTPTFRVARIRWPALPPRGVRAALLRPTRLTLGVCCVSGSASLCRPPKRPAGPVHSDARCRRPLPVVDAGSSRAVRSAPCALPRECVGCCRFSVRRACSDASPRGSVGCRHASRCRARVLTGHTVLGRRMPVWPRSRCNLRLLTEVGRGWPPWSPESRAASPFPPSLVGRGALRLAKCWVVPPSVLPAVLPCRSRPLSGSRRAGGWRTCSRK